MTLSSAIGDVLFSKTQQRVLSVLYGQPNKSFYMNEIVRIAGMGKGTVMRELNKLTSVGLITSEKKGNQTHFLANENNPIFTELKSIVDKTFGITGILAENLQELLPHIELAFVYGSIAKGEEHAESDIDLMLVADELSYTEVMNSLQGAEEILKRSINPNLYSPKEFKNKMKSNAFVKRISEQNKLWLHGQERFEKNYVIK